MSRKGSVFILFLWVFILLTLFAISIGFRMRMAAKISKAQAGQFVEQYDFLSAVNLARYFIDLDQEAKVDSAGDVWYGTPKLFAAMTFAERFGLEIDDEESKLDLNKAPAPVVQRFFELLKENGVRLEGDPRDLTAGILTWRGQGSIGGRPTLGFDHKRMPFESLEELALGQFVSVKDAELMRPYVTVYSAGTNAVMQLNLNTVQPLVLKALIDSLTGGEFDKNELLQKIESFRKGKPQNPYLPAEKQVFQKEDLRVDALMMRLQLTDGIAMNQLVGQLLPFLSVDSQYFRVRIRSLISQKTSRGAEIVLGPRFLKPAPVSSAAPAKLGAAGSAKLVTAQLEILDWQEGTILKTGGKSL